MRGYVRRGVAYAAVATTVTTAAQAGVLTATYVTAPEAKGPRFGLECRQTTTTTTTKGAGAGRRVVFVAGDSTVCGVGCATSDRCDGPTLPRRLARALGEALDVDVEWRALGYKGADVRALRAKLLPALREAMRGGEDEADGGGMASSSSSSPSSSSSSSPPHVVVLMCGLNDAKHSIVGRTTTEFRRDLEALVRDIRDVVGEKCVVVIPATPLEAATLFPPPLVWVATRMNDAWDAQKRRVSELAENVVFVSKPSLEALRARVTKENGGRVVMQLTCADGVHPNDDGYAAWAAHIADECAPSLKAALNAELRD